MQKFLLFFFSLITVFSIEAQSMLPIGGWKSHLPYHDAKWVTQSKDKVYFATSWSVFSVTKDEVSPQFFSKIDGLSDVGITRIAYDNFNDQLIIAYTNSNIDIVSEDGVFNLPQLKDNTVITGNKQIFDIHIGNEKSCYFATTFGILELDLINREFGPTVFTELIVNNITSLNNFLYAATEDGVYKIELGPEVNIGVFNDWKRLAEQVGLPVLYEADFIRSYKGNVFVMADDQVWKEDVDGNFSLYFDGIADGFFGEYLSAEGDKLIVGARNEGFSSKAYFLNENQGNISGGANCITRSLYAVEDEKNRVWFADELIPIRYIDSYSSGCNTLEFNSPLSQTTGEIAIKNNVTFIASGGASDNFGPLQNFNGFYILKDGIWTNYYGPTYPPISENGFFNFLNIAPHPKQNKVFIGSYQSGLMELDLDTDESIFYTRENSSLQQTVGDISRTRVAGLAFDNSDNLWISNFGAQKPLSVLNKDGNWFSYNVPNNDNLAQIAIDDLGYKWVVAIGNNGGILVYDDKGTLEVPSDDRSRYITSINSEITTSLVNCVAIDLDGEVWVGTAEGPVIFECGSAVFEEGSCPGLRKKVLQDSIAAFLLETENIRTIEIDGANRKWFGTKNGIFVQSPDGETQVLRLTVTNSLLFDNDIIDLSFNDETGEMWIATNKGVQVYRTDATSGKNTHDANVYAYPNPVRPDYNGPIAIKGLARDADVKITDLNGKLVYETTALGGQAIWDGRDYNGRRAATGVYLVFSASTSSFDSVDSFVTKIMMVSAE